MPERIRGIIIDAHQSGIVEGADTLAGFCSVFCDMGLVMVGLRNRYRWTGRFSEYH